MSKEFKIAQKLLLKAPPGEYDLCLNDLKKIIDHGTVKQAELATKVLWHENNYTYVYITDHHAILCGYGRQPDGTYFDPHTGYVFYYNFDTNEVTPTGIKGPEQSPLCTELLPKLESYVFSAYRESSCAAVYSVAGGGIVIILRSSSISIQNFCTGGIFGQYYLQPNGQLSGSIKSLQHYFEEGNSFAHFDCNMPPESIDMAQTNSEISDQILDTITRFESRYRKAAMNAYDSVDENRALSILRLKLPYTGTRINWELELSTRK